MLKTRVITAIFLLFGFVGVLFFVPDWFAAAVFAAVAALAAWEWAGFMQVGSVQRQAYAWLTLLVAGLLTYGGFTATALPVLCALSCLFWVGVVPLWFKYRWPLRASLSGYLFGWLVVLPTWVALLQIYRRDALLLLAAMALVWIADIAAYFSGRAFGKHKLAPTISPGKTREGAVGAIIAVLVYGFCLSYQQQSGLLSRHSIVFGCVLVGLTVLSIMGDLFESLLKRQAGLKDSSQLLPGHGGVLDRIDSQTSTLPMVALYLYWMAA